MKKIALALVAVSTLGLAACGGNKATNTANSTGAATNEAIADVNVATTDAVAANATNSALDANANTLTTNSTVGNSTTTTTTTNSSTTTNKM